VTTRWIAASTAALLLLAGAGACSGSDDGGSSARSTTTTSLAAPRTPSFAVGDLTGVDQCALLTVAEAGALLHRPAALSHQETMGNAGTCTVQATGAPLALVQWNVDPAALDAGTYTRRLADLEEQLADLAGPQGCGGPTGKMALPAEGLGDGARLLTCGSTVEVVASTGGHLLLLTVTRPPDPAGNDDIVQAARTIVSRLPK
jgi:hypothetical protein